MRNKALLTVVAIVAVVAMGGIGFAQFTSVAYQNITSQAGTFNLEWTGTPSVVAVNCALTGSTNPVTDFSTATCEAPTDGAASYVSCGAYFPAANTMDIYGNNLNPGDGCAILASSDVNLYNSGSLPGTVTLGITATGGSCAPGGGFEWADNEFNTLGGYEVNQGTSSAGTVSIGAYSDMPVATSGWGYLGTSTGYGTVIWLDPTATCGPSSTATATITFSGTST